MAILNRILNVIIVLLAIFALVVSFKLYEKRNQLRDSRNKLASSIVKVVKELDTKSPKSEQLASEITFDESNNGKGGSLGWEAYGQNKTALDSLLGKFEKHAQTVRTQRDNLSDEIVNMAKIFEQEDVDAASLNDPEKYAEDTGKIKDMMTSYKQRDDFMTENLIKARSKFGDFNQTQQEIRLVKNYNDAFNEVNKQIDFLLQRKKKLEDVLVSVVTDLEGEQRFNLMPDAIRDVRPTDVETLQSGIKKIMNTVKEVENLRDLNSQLEKEIVSLKQKIADLNEEIIAQKTTITDQKRKIEAQEKEIKILKGGDDDTISKKAFDGKVIKVNYDYNYVIVNIGGEQDLGLGLVMTIARGREYICQVKVKDIYKNYAVAEILPGMKAGRVLPGDRVIYLPDGSL